MKKIISIVGCMLAIGMCGAQGSDKRVYRLYINHADPQLIYMLLAGKTNFSTPPEMSTLTFGGQGYGNGGFGNSGPGRPGG
jgi:hypothetical protein